MTVRSDSKGRLTGAIPGVEYTKKTHPDGRIEYIPKMETFHPNLETPVVVVSWSDRSANVRVSVDVPVSDVPEVSEVVSGVSQALGTTSVLVHNHGRLGAVMDYLTRNNPELTVAGYV